LNHKFIVYDKQINLLVAVYDVRTRNEVHLTDDDFNNNIFPTGRNIEIIEFLVYDHDKKQWLYKDSSYFEELIEPIKY
jgi:non-homologous end joining protein Ku